MKTSRQGGHAWIHKGPRAS